MMFLRILALLAMTLLVSCGGGGGDSGSSPLNGGSTPALFSSAPAALNIEAGKASEFTIGGGKAAYSVTSSDLTVASVGLSGTSGFIISGVKGGSATVTIKDSQGNALAIAVTVGSSTPLFTTAPAQVTLTVGAPQSFVISGGAGPYAATSSNSAAATAIVSGANLTLTGVASGASTVSVVDSKGTAVSIAVTVGAGQSSAPLFTSAASTVVIASGSVPTYTVGGGTGPYTVSSSDAAIARAALAGTTLSITALVPGTATIVVTDALGVKVTIGVTVGTSNVVALYTTAPSPLTLAKGASRGFDVGGGVGPYTASSANTSVASAAVAGTSLSITGLGVGTAQVSIFDSQGRSVSVAVTVSAEALTTSAPATLVMATGEQRTFVVGGGTPFGSGSPYLAESSNKNVVDVSAVSSSGVLTIVAKGPGTALVQITDSQGKQLPVTSVTVGPSTTLLVDAPDTVTLPQGGARTFKIAGGLAPYFAQSGNEDVVFATLNGSTLTLQASSLRSGVASVAVRDSAGATKVIAVTVSVINPLSTSAPDTLVMSKGEVRGGFSVSGGTAPYTVASTNENVAQLSTATLASSAATYAVTAKGVGTSSLVIRDATGAQASVAVTVATAVDLFTTAPSTLTMRPGATQTYQIFGGTGPYTVTSNNESLITRALRVSEFDLVAATNVNSGSAVVTITDSVGKSLPVTVTVSTTAPSPIAVTPTAVTLAIGDAPVKFFVSGGSPAATGYVASSSNDAVVTAAGGIGQFTVTPGTRTGTASILVQDDKGQSKEVVITVVAASTVGLFTSAPAALTLPAGGQQRSFSVGGGTGSYTFESSNSSIVSIPIKLAQGFTIQSGSALGTATVTLRDSAGNIQSITVTVASAQSLSIVAPAAVTIKAPASAGAAGVPASYYILGGTLASGGTTYRVVSSNAAVATVATSVVIDGTVLSVTPVSAGTTTVSVFDSVGNSATLTVTVSAAGTQALQVNPAAVTVQVGDVVDYTVVGGEAPYQFRVSNPLVASVVATSTNTFRVTALRSQIAAATVIADTTVQVVDSQNQVVSSTLTVRDSAPSTLSISPLELYVNENVLDKQYFTIRGGTAPFQVFASDNTVTVKLLTGGELAKIEVSPNPTFCGNGLTPVASPPVGRVRDVVITVVESTGTGASAATATLRLVEQTTCP